MVSGSFYIPKKNPGRPLGEDSHFIDQALNVIGVADGVGSTYEYKGIDSGEFARELMAEAAEIVRKRLHDVVPVNPRQVLEEAFSKSKSPGSSTACIMALDLHENDLRIKAVSVGDSGFVVIRREKVVFTSPVRQLRFNQPFQIRKKAGSTTCRGLEVAEEFEVAMQAGNVIIAASDGLFDNLFPEQIERVVKMSLQQNDPPDVLARSLATAALKKSLDTSCESPFAKAARAAGFAHSGGKYDDITVVAAYVQAI
ncbi:probable protein phosphatase 2C 55 [Henckelia pumila]|uniref:probable protein phosphatase 2C 55 n=1 Tax=Henckelia pumila TaxID=405737 RepID=UPI003C6DEA06